MRTMYNQKYAGFWKRLGAFLIDQIILGIAHLVVIIPFWGFFIWDFLNLDEPDKSPQFVSIQAENFNELELTGLFYFAIAFMIISLIIDWLYYALLESSAKQATVGKMVFSIKVTDSEGKRISFARASGRHFAKILSGMFLMIGYIMAGFTSKKQTLHDIISDCVVINTLYIDYEEIGKQNQINDEWILR